MKVFKNANEFNKYINAKKLTSIGYGSEGVFYQSLVDGMGYKILYPEIIDDYKPNNIIVASEVETNGFIFPIELFVVKGKLIGYKTSIIKQNLLDVSKFSIYDFDFKKFKEAYKKFKIEVANLSRQKIEIYDLFNNIIYDGENIYAIDTCMYERSNEKKLLRINIDNLEWSITLELENLAVFSGIEVQKRNELELSVIEYINYLERIVRKEKIKILKEEGGY